jgi:cytochrome b subunit of formate dehydrogenase
MLAITGLTQTFDNVALGQQLMLALGGLEAVQQVHHLFALFLCGLALVHALNFLDSLFVRRQVSKLLPTKSDWEHFVQFLRLNKLPLFERYSFDEKFVYWVIVIAVGVLTLTGLGLWFPTWVTLVLPGSYFQYAAAIHRWQAIFVVIVILSLHTYQVLLRKRNFSIFTGRISLEDMQEDHPVELAYLEKLAALVQEGVLPKTVEFAVEERHPRKIYIYVEPEPDEDDEDEAHIEAGQVGQPETAEEKANLHMADGEAVK